MTQAVSVFPIDRLELALTPTLWTFAVERRAEIDAFFAELQRQKPAIWNGRVHSAVNNRPAVGQTQDRLTKRPRGSATTTRGKCWHETGNAS